MPEAITLERLDPSASSTVAALLSFWRERYADDPAWVAPLAEWLRRRLDSDNPFFREAELRLYRAVRGGRTVGTVSSLRDQRHERLKGEAVAFFGFFEAVDDPAVARALIDQAEADAREWGATLLRGPRNLTRVEEVGLTVDGFEFRPPLLASHHPPTYAPMIEALGFQKHHDVLAYHRMIVEPDGSPTPLPDKLVSRAAACRIPGLEVRPADLLHMDRDLSLAHEVFVEAFRDVPENTPMPREQFVHLGRLFLLFTSRQLLQLATVDGKAAGFGICVPEMNEALQSAGGRLLPLGWTRVLAAFPRIQTASFKLIGVLPEHRHSGLNSRLIQAAVEGVQAAGYHRIEGSLIDERNAASRGTVEGLGLEVYKRYRIYQRALPT